MTEAVVSKGTNPYLAAPQAKKMITLIGIYIAILGSLIQSNTMSTMLPLAAAEIGGTDYYSLASNVSGVVGIVLMPLWGYLCAKAPQIKPGLFAISLIIGAATIFIRAIAPTMMVVIVSGSLYGLVSCAIFVVGYSMIRTGKGRHVLRAVRHHYDGGCAGGPRAGRHDYDGVWVARVVPLHLAAYFAGRRYCVVWREGGQG